MKKKPEKPKKNVNITYSYKIYLIYKDRLYGL